ncbi:MAG: DUF2797 domain-containing protein [Flavobacteriia bacterium]|nr:DUF2797 domain-containing protein [Flavobacteriia bacterium]
MNIILSKLFVQWNNPVQYSLNSPTPIFLNELMGKIISLRWTGKIYCANCNKNISKTYGEGYCYPCFISVPQASPCVINPELCRAHLGEGRDIEWEKKYHLQLHNVYLSFTSGIKVGITRKDNILTRWIDQGAIFALVIAETPNRYLAGLIEVALKNQYADKTSWQKMLCSKQQENTDLLVERDKINQFLSSELQHYLKEDEKLTTIKYPHILYPQKVQSIRLEKTPFFEKELVGIKGQYLIFSDSTVINLRNHTGFNVEFTSKN